MKKTVKYKLVRENSQEDLEIMVNGLLAKGWELQGAPQYNWFAGVYTQAMVKTEEVK